MASSQTSSVVPAADFGSCAKLCASEPFRLFFPWGISTGMLGALLWPMFYGGWLTFYPNQVHARLMILGFGGALIVGFLGTAAPRMLGAKPLRGLEVAVLWITHATAVTACLRGSEVWGSGLFALTLILLGVIIGLRFRKGTDLPPPGFVLVALGVLCGIVGALLCASGKDQAAFAGSYRLARLLMDEAFLLLPIVGVGGFLIARILGVPCRQMFPDAVTPSTGWWKLAAEALFLGLVVLLSLWLEAVGWVRLGPGLRLVAVVLYWQRDLPGWWAVKPVGTQAWMIKQGLLTFLIAWIARVIDPIHLFAMEHVLFITGFAMVMLAIASRVADGHSGHRASAKDTSKTLRWIYWLSLLTMLTRVTADYFPKIQASHYQYAAYLWGSIGLIWLIAYGRKLKTADPEG